MDVVFNAVNVDLGYLTSWNLSLTQLLRPDLLLLWTDPEKGQIALYDLDYLLVVLAHQSQMDCVAFFASGSEDKS